ncbi:hypothetical protein MP228_003845 [Amoeboaphelidium protococcarum]|nr:hypothetical protein MP228_003845 [Amoeboaphelidium protococcarum]
MKFISAQSLYSETLHDEVARYIGPDLTELTPEAHRFKARPRFTTPRSSPPRLRYASFTAARHCYYHLKHLLRPLKQLYTRCLPLSPLLSSDVSALSCPLTASASGCPHSTCLLMSLLPPPVDGAARFFSNMVWLLRLLGVIVLSAQGVSSVCLSQCTLRIDCTLSSLLTMVMSSICILGNICGLSR